LYAGEPDDNGSSQGKLGERLDDLAQLVRQGEDETRKEVDLEALYVGKALCSDLKRAVPGQGGYRSLDGILLKVGTVASG